MQQKPYTGFSLTRTMYMNVLNKLKIEKYQQMTSGDGLFHEGSPRDESSALEQSFIIAFITNLGLEHTL